MFEITQRPVTNPLERVRRGVNQLFETPWIWPERLFQEMPAMEFPVVDIKETDDAFVVSAEVPGVRPEEIDIQLTGNELTIKGEKKESKEETKGGYRLEERSYGYFTRTFRLPMEVDNEKITASHDDGVVLITLPKSEKAATQKIRIK